MTRVKSSIIYRRAIVRTGSKVISSIAFLPSLAFIFSLLDFVFMKRDTALLRASSTVISRRLSVLRKQLLDPGTRAPGDLSDDPHGFALSMKNEGNPGLRHTQVPGDPSLGQIVLPHDSLNFFCHSRLTPFNLNLLRPEYKLN